MAVTSVDVLFKCYKHIEIKDFWDYCRIMQKYLISLLSVLLLLLSPLQAQSDDLYIMAEEYPPYSYIEAEEPTGFMVELIEAVLDKIGENKVDIHFYPWARAYKKLQLGDGDVLFPMDLTPESSGCFKFVGPVFWDDVYFYKLRGSKIDISSVDDAREVGRIAVTRDDVYHQNLVKLGFNNLDVSSSQRSDFFKLAQGRVDLAPMGKKVFRYFISITPGLDSRMFERVGPAVFFSSAYFAFSMKTPDAVIHKWQTAFDSLKEDGTVQEIIDRYYPPDTVRVAK